MHLLDVTYSSVMIIVGSALIILGCVMLRLRNSVGARYISLALFGSAVWTLTYVLELHATDLVTKLFWAKISYFGIIAAPFGWLGYILVFTGRDRWLTRRNLILASIIPIVSLALAWTNDAHGLIWANTQLLSLESLSIIDYQTGAALWIYGIYSYIMISIGMVQLIRVFTLSHSMYRWQALGLFIGALFPVIGSIQDIIRVLPLDLTPLAFTVTVISLGWSRFRFRMGEIVMVAHDSVFRGMSDGVLVINQHQQIVEINPAAEKIFKKTEADVIGKPGNVLWNGWQEVQDLSTQHFDAFQEIIIPQNGVDRCYDLRISTLAGGDEKSLGYVVVFRDMTDSIRVEKEIQELRELNDGIVQNMTECIVVDDADGAIIFVNPTFERVLGFSYDDLIGKNWRSVIPEEQHKVVSSANKRRRKGGADRYELMLKHKDGTPVTVQVSGTPRFEGDQFVGTIAVFTDISERIETERALQESEEQLRSYFEQANDMLFTLDVNGIITSVNKKICEVTGYSTDELIGRSPIEILTPESKELAEKMFERILTDGDIEQVEYEIESKDGEHRWIEVRGRTLKDDENLVSTFYIGRDITERKRTKEQLTYLAQYDHLTGLANRKLFRERFHDALIRGNRSNQFVGLMFLDLDHFKAVNDMLGHNSGDLMLKAAAERLVKSVRDTDTVARFGGDEFTVILENLKDPQDAALIAQKILDNMTPPFEMQGNEFYLSTSIGITIYPIDGENIDDLLRDADAAMYRAKDHGRNNYQFYKSEMNARAFERQSFNSSLHRAIERQEFLLHYQPQIDLRSGHIIGLEALIRWQHPEFGLVSPSQFIPVAEDTELIIPIGDWVLRTACAQVQSWKKKTFPQLSLSINLSARQFRRNDFATQVFSVIQASGINPESLELELTESMLMENIIATDATLHLLKEMGVGLSIDDFGTGYSSLSYLQRFPIDSIKIAQVFMQDIPEIPDVAAIVKAIIALGRNLRLQIIAEGVETQEQLAFLKEHDCDIIQGNLISKPLPADQMTQFILAWDPGVFFRISGDNAHQAWLFPYMESERRKT